MLGGRLACKNKDYPGSHGGGENPQFTSHEPLCLREHLSTAFLCGFSRNKTLSFINFGLNKRFALACAWEVYPSLFLFT